MHKGIGEPLTAMLEAVSTLFGWIMTVLLTLIVGFCLGYWIGHGEISAAATLRAFSMIPLLWLGCWPMFLAYGVTVMAIYLPMRHEGLWLKLAVTVVNLLTWLIIIHSIVVQTAHSKFFRY